ncbi:hypothetical protein A3G67_02935 [Candidatus Roizmanbacteria bacterium RIFCSPLOWO2_12_FULL_40_12]|uniref:Uncharacterized protein n=1 Tax=Candidatus Roizmanbacteria bacterium RIFCSPLOWO2_01_FULL_40_42 TaxID=1802066 RepID=A0A1F7J2U1_9BACT|nr:MAG: hypothetical protein A2779_00465 [Candidatus Roizmanbacteria bacterium RIFCSPHIGHO2_01_FULL_40_98]OGK27530.1 MAG: hypothetical protein A3C31_03620 [Candidatus Roizmanbacteria bacterium RIFCSPHIGHO2_02_FULL_40_53]OGK30286.1 MAG: hypothetical protein A2W49_01105 [Candidatus Roizmanbacteria bacterium RIFCSPHIGHO2_12_41_18]OGK37114.1 MAG: hypothetical protein A3E69_01490 [Candidatus Roizmanbacteria bacterium RIFCSPHIGHO2_12_FULL_40_130]OGK49892.1 MAG: hypothetical protein A3B50_03860 [Candi
MKVEYRGLFPLQEPLPKKGVENSNLLFVIREVLLEHAMEAPHHVVNLKAVAGQVGCSRELVRTYYDRLYPNSLFPPRMGKVVVLRKYFDPIVLELYREGQSINGIAQIVNVDREVVRNSLKRSGERIPSRREQTEEKRQRIVRLRNIFGMGDLEIVKRTGFPRGVVTRALGDEMKTGKAKRLRKSRRSPEELEAFDAKVESTFEELRETGKKPTYKDVANELNCEVWQIEAALIRNRNRLKETLK